MCVKCNYSVTRKSSVLLILFVQSCVRTTQCLPLFFFPLLLPLLLLMLPYSRLGNEQNMIGTKEAFDFTFFVVVSMRPFHSESIKCHRVQIGQIHFVALILSVWRCSEVEIFFSALILQIEGFLLLCVL